MGTERSPAGRSAIHGVMLVVGQLCFTSCAREGSPVRAAHVTPSTISRHALTEFLPLEDNTTMSFETHTEGSAEPGLLVMQVRRPRTNVVELDVSGKIRRLDLTPDGVRLIDGGWLLKKPLEVGATFPGQNGRVRVVSTTREVIVPAGHFRDCVEIEEASPSAKTITVFCPRVGIALLEVESTSVDNPERVTARLKSCGPRIDIGADQLRVQPE